MKSFSASINIKAPREKIWTILTDCAEEKLFTPPIFSQPALERIAQSIMDICWEWRWG